MPGVPPRVLPWNPRAASSRCERGLLGIPAAALGFVALVLCLLGELADAGVLPGSYRRMRLFELALEAEAVVAGEIVAVSASTFDLRVDHRLIESATGERVRVHRFEDWTCAQRWTEYAAGQRVLLFLESSHRPGAAFEILGVGGEGEMPLAGSDAFLRGYRVRELPEVTLDAGGRVVAGTRTSIPVLSAALQGLRREVRRSVARTSWGEGVGSLAPSASLATLEAFASTSSIARHLCGEARTSPGWQGPRPAPDSRLAAGEARELSFLPEGDPPHGEGPPLAALVAFCADVDADGADDLIAHTAGAQAPEGEGWPAFRLASLDPSIRTKQRRSLGIGELPPPGMPWTQLAAAECLSVLGDLDGDGGSELFVGDSRAAPCGAAWLLFVDRTFTVRRVVEVGSQEPLRDAGVVGQAGFGRSVAALGDLDGDGTLELAIGQDPSLGHGQEHGRRVWVASLAGDGSVSAARPLAAGQGGWDRSTLWFGEALARLGDLDQDGVTELAIGSPGDDDGGDVRGAVWIAFLARDGTLRRARKISEWSRGFPGELEDGSLFGCSLAAPGDVDGDGVPDLLVGTRKAVWTLLLDREGEVRVARRLEVEIDANRWSGHASPALAAAPRTAGGEPTCVLLGRGREPESRVFRILWLDRDGVLRAERE